MMTRNILPIINVGQSDTVNSRIDLHYQNKEFWDWGVVFVSTSAGFGRGHNAWIEHALIRQARQAKQSKMDNDQGAKEPALSELKKADAQRFLARKYSKSCRLVGLRIFEVGKAVATPKETVPRGNEGDTIVVPAKKDGFDRASLVKIAGMQFVLLVEG